VMTRVLLDTGPLVAFLDRRDRYHTWAKAQWAEIEPPLLTCEAVVTEACFLVRDLPGGSTTVVDMLTRGVVRIEYDLQVDAAPIGKLLSRYANLPMSLADACLVRMAEQFAGSRVLTIDRGFRVFRMYGRQVIPTAMPPDL
jgi:predicted nucleic acid-binding protein